MSQKILSSGLLPTLAVLTLCAPFANAAKPTVAVAATRAESGVLWGQPSDIESRNLYYGPGGQEHQPHGPYTFVEEDLSGTNPKFVVRDRDNVKWTLKLGMEAQPETVASRLVWAVGYSANEDYYLPEVKVAGMPLHLKRGRKLVGADGTMPGARLKRHLESEKMIGTWAWRDDPFTGTRELNGLKVMMALINNWDLKDANNKVYAPKDGTSPVYMVSDLGSSFGPSNLLYPFRRSKGDLGEYVRSKFITRITSEYVDFATPGRPSWEYAVSPFSFVRRVHLDKLLHNVPRDDVRWIGGVLAGLSDSQIRDAFRAAGYTQDQVAAFSKVVEDRIGQLRKV